VAVLGILNHKNLAESLKSVATFLSLFFKVLYFSDFLEDGFFITLCIRCSFEGRMSFEW
jgi:hypothetical protein